MNTLAVLVTVLLLLVLGLLFLCARGSLRQEAPGNAGWGVGTRYFLILLRLAIGWHFLIEGLDKIHSATWSSEGYLREATGPLAPVFRELAGDKLKERLTVNPPGGFPETLGREWDRLIEAYIVHYGLDDQQAERARAIVSQRKKESLHWMLSKPKKITITRKHVAYTREMTVPERIAAYEKLDGDLRRMEEVDLPTYGAEAFPRYRETRGEIARLRAELQADLAEQTAAMRIALRDVLSDEQKTKDPLPVRIAQPVSEWTRLDWSDFLVKWGLVVVGGCLLLGLFTRTACIGGVLFLLMFFVSMPPLPGWPESPRSEGHYFLINKHIVEMLALLVLATTRSGRWAGLDGLVFNVRRMLARPAPTGPQAPRVVETRASVSPARQEPPASPPKEISHGT